MGDHSSDCIFYFVGVYSLTRIAQRTEQDVRCCRSVFSLPDCAIKNYSWRRTATKVLSRRPLATRVGLTLGSIYLNQDAPNQSQEPPNSRSPEMERREPILGVRRHGLRT
jgi:hypothetical protein